MRNVRLTYERVLSNRNEAIRDWITFLTDLYTDGVTSTLVSDIKSRLIYEERIPDIREIATITKAIYDAYIAQGISATYANKLIGNYYIENIIYALNGVVKDIILGNVVLTEPIQAPVNTVAPAITGTGEVGQVLTVSNGTWTNGVDSYTYQWRKNGTDNIGTNSNQFTITTNEAFGTIDCVVTATNVGGSTPQEAADTSTIRYIFVRDIFDRPALSPWTEVDAGSQITVTMINPGVQLSGSPFSLTRQIRYGTNLTTAVRSWKITCVAQIDSASTGFLAIGVAHSINPALNLAVFAEAILLTGDGSTGLNRISSGTGTTNDVYSIRNTSSDTPLPLTPNVDYVITLQRDYNGSGDAVYTSTCYLASAPENAIDAQWTEVGAGSQANYDITRPCVSQMSGITLVKSFEMELLN